MSCLTIFTNAGIKVYVCPNANIPATNTKTAWEAVTGWLEISNPSTLGARGVSRRENEYKLLDWTICKVPGAKDGGSLDFRVADQPEDAGQLLLYTASEGSSPYGFKVVHADTTTTYDVATTEYMLGRVGEWQMAEVNDSDSIREITCRVSISADWYLKVPRYDATP
jgi:hypothetical protein